MFDSTVVKEKEATLAESGQLEIHHSDRARRRSLPSVLRHIFIACGGVVLAALIFTVLIKVGV